jgi:hypothetical protein
MGGEIEVRSAPGAGTTFFVRLLRPGAVATSHVDEPEDPPPPTMPLTPGELAPEPSIVREFMRQIGIPSQVA